MVSCLTYRGPDADGIYLDEKISLGHNRLSIIDLSKSANQPMLDNKEELIIVFNGEIYNFQELKKELEDEYQFKTKSDTEVILAGYRKWGRNLAEHLNGMFAFAIWDKRNQSLLCARDRAGIKPFYYYWDGKKFIFASEMQALFTHSIPRKLNLKAFNHYLRVLYVPEPLTMIENISKLPPGHILIFKNNKIAIEAYDRAPIFPTKLSYGEAQGALKELVHQSVKRHLISDVPVGVYLSGGIDSSAVLSSMSKFHQNIKTFTIGFELTGSEEKDKFNQDFLLAQRTADFFKTEHHSVIVSAKDALGSFETMTAHNSDPISNPTSIAMLLLAKFARKHVTVVLTGNSGDELFGGYDRYRIALLAYYYQKLPAFMRKMSNLDPKIRKLNYQSEVDLFAQFMFQKDELLKRVVKSGILEKDVYIKEFFYDRYLSQCRGDASEYLMSVDQKSWLPDHFFMLSDKMSMASTLEERVPLADKELIAFARSLPRSYKLDLFRTKKILKDAFKNDLPSFLFDQPKRGWFSPAAKWLRDPEFLKMVKERLSETYYAPTGSLFNWSEVNQILENHVSKKEYNLVIIWAILTFQSWARKYQVEI